MKMKRKGEFNMSKRDKRSCWYKDKAMLYALTQINDEVMVLLSATEMCKFDEYLRAAREGDKGIMIDLETCDNEPYQIVYGAMMFHDREQKAVLDYIQSSKNCALISIDGEEFGKITSSVYDDIQVFENKGKYDESMPFVALMKTLSTEDKDTSTTMFPCCDRTVWENLVNRAFLLACRKFVKIDGLTLENWKSYIDMEILDEAYYYADLYTGKTEDVSYFEH